jgi:hypothetical protein
MGEAAMTNQPDHHQRPSWAYVALAVLLTAIGNGWNVDDVRALCYALLALLTIAHVTHPRH